MHSVKKKIGIGILVLSICILVGFDIHEHARKDRVIGSLTQKGTFILTPSLAEILLKDIELGGQDRAAKWSNYFSMWAAGSGYRPPATVQDAYTLYISKESPGRSNHFHELVFKLREQSSSILTRKSMLGYLGDADFTSGGADRQTLQYKYKLYGQEWIASAVVSNDVVVRIDIYVK